MILRVSVKFEPDEAIHLTDPQVEVALERMRDAGAELSLLAQEIMGPVAPDKIDNGEHVNPEDLTHEFWAEMRVRKA
jgi:hypothetical protein